MASSLNPNYTDIAKVVGGIKCALDPSNLLSRPRSHQSHPAAFILDAGQAKRPEADLVVLPLTSLTPGHCSVRISLALGPRVFQ